MGDISVFRRIERLYVSLFFLFKYIVDCNEYTCFLHVPELIIDGCTKNFHCRRQAHVCINKWRDVDAMFPYTAVQNAVIFLEIEPGEQLAEPVVGIVVWQRHKRSGQLVRVREMLAQEVEQHVA